MYKLTVHFRSNLLQNDSSNLFMRQFQICFQGLVTSQHIVLILFCELFILHVGNKDQSINQCWCTHITGAASWSTDLVGRLKDFFNILWARIFKEYVLFSDFLERKLNMYKTSLCFSAERLYRKWKERGNVRTENKWFSTLQSRPSEIG